MPVVVVWFAAGLRLDHPAKVGGSVSIPRLRLAVCARHRMRQPPAQTATGQVGPVYAMATKGPIRGRDRHRRHARRREGCAEPRRRENNSRGRLECNGRAVPLYWDSRPSCDLISASNPFSLIIIRGGSSSAILPLKIGHFSVWSYFGGPFFFTTPFSLPAALLQ